MSSPLLLETGRAEAAPPARPLGSSIGEVGEPEADRAPRSLDLTALSGALSPLGLEDRLRLIRDRVPGGLVFTTSFGLEDQALTHALVASGIEVAFATLDTGRLFAETLELWADTERVFGIRITVASPDANALEALIEQDGPLGFRRSVEARQSCCAVRKIAPLRRALSGAGGWITGLRADQSAHRARTPFAERDRAHGLLKLNPLADWNRDRVSRYVAQHRVPTNPLHAQGYLSIGCAPCTRAILPGEPERAGRWWWESDGRRECGLHERRTSPHPEPANA